MTSSQSVKHPTYLRGRRLRLVQAGWLVLVALMLGSFGAGVPTRLSHLQTVASAADTGLIFGLPPALQPIYTQRLGPAEVEVLHRLGLSQPVYAAYVVLCEVGLALACVGIAVLIFWRRSDDWLALWVSLTLVLLGTNSGQPEVPTLATVWSGWGLVYISFMVTATAALGMVSHIHILFLSPDGRFAPPWTLALSAAFTGGVLALAIYGATVTAAWGIPSVTFVLLAVPAWWLLVGLGIASQIYRYRRISNPVQRQQTKWVVVGLAGFTLGFLVNGLAVFAASRQAGEVRLLANLARSALVNGCLLLLPIGLGFSILRYRLWDIDLIVRRTLIYSLLTATLVVVYLSSVVLLQALFQRLTGEIQSPAVTVVSTLAIAALFVPLRRRIQDFVDRLFYRRKYDAAKIIAAFSAAIRNETDLTQLSASLVQVVAETMQPTLIDLWLVAQDTSKDH